MHTARERIRTVGVLCIIIAGIAIIHVLAASNAGTPAQAESILFECSDNIDNDNDGYIDYPADPNCDALDDQFEGPMSSGIKLTLSDGKETVEPGGDLSYIIHLSTKLAEPQIVDVRFVLPEHATVISSSDHGFLNGVTILWPQVTVFPENPRTLSVNLQINPSANEGEKLYAKVEAFGEQATDVTTVAKDSVPAANWTTISITNGKSVAAPNDILTYRIVVTNRETIDRDITIRAEAPAEFIMHEVTGDHNKNGRRITWDSLEFGPKETREFFVTGHVEHDTADYYPLRFTVSTGKYLDRDTTTIRRGGKEAIDALIVGVNDGQQVATNGQILEYEVSLKNPTNTLVTNLEVSAGLPNYTEFVDSLEGGEWTGGNVLWKGLTVSPFGSRVLHFAVRVRSDAPLGTGIRAGVIAMGQEAYDVTEVGISRVGTAKNTARSESNATLQMVADTQEVRPGGTVGFTITLKNTTDHPMRNITIQDKFDPNSLKIISSNKQESISGGIASWKIAELQPGKTWSVYYRMEVNPKVSHGIQLTNVVSARGEGLEELSLTDRIQTMQIGVLTKLPKSGASLDWLFLMFTSLFGAGQVAAMQLKRKVMFI